MSERVLHHVDGRELSLPMDIPDFSLYAQVFPAPVEKVRQVLRGTPLTAAELWPGTSTVTLLAVQYRDNPLGDYAETAVTFPVYAPGDRPRPWLGGLDMLTMRASQYVYAMHVDQAFTMRAGRVLWGYPKELAQIELSFEPHCVRGAFAQDGEPVFGLEVASRAGGKLSGTLTTLTYLDGVLRRIESTFEAVGVATRVGGRVPTIGERHPLALTLRGLGLPKRPLASLGLSHVSARFGVARELQGLRGTTA